MHLGFLERVEGEAGWGRGVKAVVCSHGGGVNMARLKGASGEQRRGAGHVYHEPA